MIVGVLGNRRLPETAEIGTNHRVVFGEKRGNTVPGGMCTRVAMQKQDRWS